MSKNWREMSDSESFTFANVLMGENFVQKVRFVGTDGVSYSVKSTDLPVNGTGAALADAIQASVEGTKVSVSAGDNLKRKIQSTAKGTNADSLARSVGKLALQEDDDLPDALKQDYSEIIAQVKEEREAMRRAKKEKGYVIPPAVLDRLKSKGLVPSANGSV